MVDPTVWMLMPHLGTADRTRLKNIDRDRERPCTGH